MCEMDEFSNEGRPEISSVTSRGRYEIYIEQEIAKPFPERFPRYE